MTSFQRNQRLLILPDRNATASKKELPGVVFVVRCQKEGDRGTNRERERERERESERETERDTHRVFRPRDNDCSTGGLCRAQGLVGQNHQSPAGRMQA